MSAPVSRVIAGLGVEFVSPSCTTIYLTGVSTALTRAAASSTANLGLLVTPESGLAAQANLYGCWAADNGCFTRGGTFDERRWLRWLDRQRRDDCLFAVCPDVVGDAAATIERSAPHLRHVRELGFPAALAAQDGLEHVDPPWDEFDCLFVGGTTGWKLSKASFDLCAEARRRGKWVHVGRVNSWKRLALTAGAGGADSVDGTYLAFGPEVNGPRLLAWLERLTSSTFSEGQEHRFTTARPAAEQQPGCAGVTWVLADTSDVAAKASHLVTAADDRRIAAAELLAAARRAWASAEHRTARRSAWRTDQG